jgi:hypothetical protein
VTSHSITVVEQPIARAAWLSVVTKTLTLIF